MYKTKRRNLIPLTTLAPAPSTVDTPTAIRPETSEWQKMAENGRNFYTPATSAAPISLPASTHPYPRHRPESLPVAEEFCDQLEPASADKKPIPSSRGLPVQRDAGYPPPIPNWTQLDTFGHLFGVSIASRLT